MIDKIKNNGNYIIFGILVSLIITFISLIVLACILTYTSAPESIINPSIIVINAISIFIGTTIALNNQKNKGILNVNTNKVPAAAVPATTSAAITTAKKKGLVSQLRKGKGAAGGGSYTETVKNPLGGSAGKTGKWKKQANK